MHENLGEKNVLINVGFDIFYAPPFGRKKWSGKQNDPEFG